MEDRDRYIQLAESKSAIDRMLYLFGGTRFFALMAALVAITTAMMTAYISLDQAVMQRRLAEVSSDKRQIVYQISLTAIGIRDDTETFRGNLEVIQRLQSKPQPLSVDDSAALKSAYVDLDRAASRIRSGSLSIIGKATDLNDSWRTRSDLSFSLIRSAYAQATPPPAIMTPAQSSQGGATQGWMTIESLRPIIMMMIIIIITVFFGVCIWLFCSTDDPDRMKFSDNMIRTIIGFYIGIVTGLLGLPTK